MRSTCRGSGCGCRRAAGSRRAASAPGCRARPCGRPPPAPGPATWPPKTRWRSSGGLVPRKMLTSIGSRSSRAMRASTAAWDTPKSRTSQGGRRRPPRAERVRTRDRAVGGAARWLASGAMSTDFPDGFRWGTATAAHQVEGGNWNNDWWALGARRGLALRGAERRRLRPADTATTTTSPCSPRSASTTTGSRSSGRASSPSRGEFSVAALDHYRRVCASCLAHGVEPVVTFHHFTTPRWVAEARAAGRAARPSTASLRFAERAVGHLGDLIGAGLHDQRAEHGRHHRLPARPVPARASPTTRGTARAMREPARRPRPAWCRCSRRARVTSRSGSRCR